MLPTPESLGLPSRPGPSVKTPSPLSTSTLAPTASASTAEPTPPTPPSTALASTIAAAAATTCAHCSTPPKYTCPRCSTRTCSLACSRQHKASTGCSGQRDPAAFVPLNAIGLGTVQRDYAWLEDGRRKVAGWGEGVSEVEAGNVGGLPARGGAARGRGGRGGRGAAAGKQPRKSKLDGYRWAISEIGADVDLLPDGMARRRTNQSSWNPKTRSLNLTLQFQIGDNLTSHPRVPVLPSSAPLNSLLPEGHEKDILVMPYHVPRWRERQRERAERTEKWERRQTGEPEPEAPAPPSEPAHGRKFFPPLDGGKPLTEVFRGTAFIEFPTVYVYGPTEWDAMEKTIMPVFESGKRKAEAEAFAEAEGESKRAKIDEAEEKPPALGGLGGLGDYGSDSDVDDALDGGDVELSPEMAAALGQALVADFGQ